MPTTKKANQPFPPFLLPNGEPLCGWEWVNKHLYDLNGFIPSIEIMHPSGRLIANITTSKDLKATIKAIRLLK